MSKLSVHLQLYTVRDDFENDYFGILEKVREMGYDGVEYAGVFGGLTAREIHAKTDALGLEPISAHVSFDLLEKEETIVFHKELGCRYVTIPWMDLSMLPGGDKWPEYKDRIVKLAEKLKGYDIELLYHNHNFEFEVHNGKYILDELYDSIPADLLKAQLDTCWINVANEDPVAYVNKYAGRLPIVHLKDYTADRRVETGEKLFELIGNEDEDSGEKKQDINFDFRPVGHGIMTFPPIIEAVKKAGINHVVVEQDMSTQRPAIEAAKMSIDYLRGLGN